MERIFNPFSTLEEIQKDYLTYVESFQQIRSTEIKNWISERLNQGGLLWKPPYLQITPHFLEGKSFEALVSDGTLHSGVLKFARSVKADLDSEPVKPYHHQIAAIEKLSQGRNVIVATGTGSGKSFAFGIPIVSTSLRMKEKGIKGIKAVIVYPMNALANNQYDDFTERLQGSGITIARYTGDTKFSPDESLSFYQNTTGRKKPFDCEVLSREEIQANPPDILMTNYVMLELLLTRFEDRTLFRHQGVLQYLVLDEIHTYSGKQGADVAALIRRLKQHTGTIGQLTCIGTSATVESSQGESAHQAIANFTGELFGESVFPDDVIGEVYAPLPENLDPQIKKILSLQETGPKTIIQLASDLGIPETELIESVLSFSDLPSKIHSFFSQGRPIQSCLGLEKHLNDRGEKLCPVCADENKKSPTFPLVFCRSCGAEYYSVVLFDDNRLAPAELDIVTTEGRAGYLLASKTDDEGLDNIELPESWLTPTGKTKQKFEDLIPTYHTVCRHCGVLNPSCGHEKTRVLFIPVPFLFCPECGVEHDGRQREYSKLFSYGTIGRSTATDIILSAEMRNLPEGQRKIIAFSDNRQDTALQAAHINSMSNRLQFRRLLFNSLIENGATIENGKQVFFSKIGFELFNTLEKHNALPAYDANPQRKYGHVAQQIKEDYQRYLQFLSLREMEGTHRRIHQNLEDVGSLVIGYDGLIEFAADNEAWEANTLMKGFSAEKRYDILLGLMDIMRLRLAIKHDAITQPDQFNTEVIERINPEVYVHDGVFHGSIGFSNDAPEGRSHRVYKISNSNTQMNRWVRKFINLSPSQAQEFLDEIINRLVETGFLNQIDVYGYHREHGTMSAIAPEIITMQISLEKEKQVCPRCLSVYHYKEIKSCYKTTCKSDVVLKDISQNYFLQTYSMPLESAVNLHAEEHSGQISGEVRIDIEQRFKDPENDLNVIVCTPTMELGIDIGDLNVIALRNIPPSPSNYAQRSGRAGRKGQASLITSYAGVGFARGPHDQYFFRFPEKMISGVISTPRFRLDNIFLITTHIHSLVLEVLGMGIENPQNGHVFHGLKLPSSPFEILEIDHDEYPMHPDLRSTWEQAVTRYFPEIQKAVQDAFKKEIDLYDWFDENYVDRIIRNFVNNLDKTFNYWREEYKSLYKEGREIENHLLTIQGDKARTDRMNVIAAKLEAMRNGEKDWYVYRYLGSQGFLPGYAFPPQAVYLSFYNNKEEIARNPSIAITEYAPGNYIYYRGSSYKISGARAQTLNLVPATQKILICPECDKVYIGDEVTTRARCDCGNDLGLNHPETGMVMCNMYARPDSKISSDEEERRRLGYEISQHFLGGGHRTAFLLMDQGQEIGSMDIENNGTIFIMNHGQRLPDGNVSRFALCSKCNRWLLSEKEIEDHFSTPQKRGSCPANANKDDVVRDLGLTHEFKSDVLIFKIKLPEGQDPDVFYISLMTAIARGIMIGFNLEEQEIGYFISKNPDSEAPYQMIFYETSLGGSGSLASMSIKTEFDRVLEKMREILHGDNEEEGCEGACYQCLLSFYNQRHHHLLDRHVILSWLRNIKNLNIEQQREGDEGKFERLIEVCGSELEKKVLTMMKEKGMRLPDEAQKIIYDNQGAPIAQADFYYEPKIIVLVDGSPHYQDFVRVGDEEKRRKLKSLGYRLSIINSILVNEELDKLIQKI
jgi:superfamily II DNA or RNA helicase